MDRKITRSDAEWQAMLGPEAYRVTRRAGTERPFTHDNFPNQPGRFHCVCCAAPLFDSADKFNSGTGWPSFTRPGAGARIAECADYSLGPLRTEVICVLCGAHLGHMFPDGPPPTGRRYCINGVALDFRPSDTGEHPAE